MQPTPAFQRQHVQVFLCVVLVVAADLGNKVPDTSQGAGCKPSSGTETLEGRGGRVGGRLGIGGSGGTTRASGYGWNTGERMGVVTIRPRQGNRHVGLYGSYCILPPGRDVPASAPAVADSVCKQGIILVRARPPHVVFGGASIAMNAKYTAGVGLRILGVAVIPARADPGMKTKGIGGGDKRS